MPLPFYDNFGERYILWKNTTIGTLLYSITKHYTYSGITFEQLSDYREDAPFFQPQIATPRIEYDLKESIQNMASSASPA
jgi:hypothetical protein